MKNSGLRVSATEWNNGRSTSRPTTITAASAAAAGASAIAMLSGEVAAVAAARQHRHQHQQRRDREVLQQQRGEAQAADRRGEAFALGEHRNDDRGRRQRQSRADRRRRRGRPAERVGDEPQRQRGDDQLAEAEFEHQPAHALDALERQFEADGEQQHDDAEFGQPVDRLDVGQGERGKDGRALGELAEAERAEGDAGEQVAEHRADAQTDEQRRDHPRRDEEQQRFLIDAEVEGFVHRSCRSRPAASLVDSLARKRPRARR